MDKPENTTPQSAYERLRTSLNSLLNALHAEYPEKLPMYVRDVAQEALTVLDDTPPELTLPRPRLVVECSGGVVQAIVAMKPDAVEVVLVDHDEAREPGGHSNRGLRDLYVDPGAVDSVFREAEEIAGRGHPQDAADGASERSRERP